MAITAIYVGRINPTIVNKIDKAPNQIIYHSRSNSRPPCGKSWEYHRGPVKMSSMTPPCLIKNHVQMNEMTCSTWQTVVPYFLKPGECIYNDPGDS